MTTRFVAPRHARAIALAALALTALAACGPANPGLRDASAADSAPQVASLQLAPERVDLSVGLVQAFSARVVTADGASRLAGAGDVQWSSSDASVASVDSAGVVRGVAVGVAQIRAEAFGQRASAAVRVGVEGALVGVEVAPADVTLREGQTEALGAQGRYADGSRGDVSATVAWRSTQPAVVAVNAAGVATGLHVGVGTVVASIGTLQSNAVNVTVTPPRVISISLSPVTVTLRAGSTMGTAITATATLETGLTQNVTELATWRSDHPERYMVSNEPGMRGAVTVSGCGDALITAEYQGVVSSPAVIWSECPTPITRLTLVGPGTLCAGSDGALTATALYGDGRTADVTASCTWSSSNPAAATVNATSGALHGVASGSTSITASIPNGNTPSMLVTATATIAVQSPVPVSLALAPDSATLAEGASLRLSTRLIDACGNTRTLSSGVRYASSDPAIAFVDSSGVVLGLAPGTATLSADASGLHAEARVTVGGP